jgi:hypothetical protein
MHWLALELPVLSTIPANGYKDDEKGRWMRDRKLWLKPSSPLGWIGSQCWNPQEISGRGRLSPNLRERKILLLGAGALGSMVAEVLVRGGAHQVMIVDKEEMAAGNLVRHLLTLSDLGRAKAPALAARLNHASPHARVAGILASFPDLPEDARAFCDHSDLVIDCTADVDVRHHLEKYPWGTSLTFVSLALGLEARRLYAFKVLGESFPAAEYEKAVRPWVEKDLDEMERTGLPGEGIGCWHPIFPAGVASIWMLAGAAVRFLEGISAMYDRSSVLAVFEQVFDGEVFKGV